MVRTRYVFSITVFVLSLMLFSCSSSNEEKAKTADKIKQMEDSIAIATKQQDSTCKALVTEILGADTCDYKRIDSLLQGENRELNCYCQLSGSRKKLGARIPIIKQFIRNKNRAYTYYFTPLQVAIAHQDLKVMKKLLESGANPNLSRDISLKPMNLALQYRNKKAMELLAQYKGDLKGCYINIAFLSVEELKKMAGYGADYNRSDSFFKIPPVQETNDYAKLKFLLDWGVNPNDTAIGGSTLLHRVVSWGNIKNINLVLKYKPNLYARDKDGNTPLHIAAGLNNRKDILEKLLPLYDLKKASTTIEELIAIAQKNGSEMNIRYLKQSSSAN